MRKLFAFFTLMFGFALASGCRQPAALPSGPVDVHAALQKISEGMSEAQVQSLLGKFSWDERASSSYQNTTTQYASLFYENPAQEPGILIVRLKNDRVEEAKVMPYPTWARNRFPPASGTPEQVKSSLGNPSLTATKVRQGIETMYWIYTDKTNSKKTLVVGFENGKVATCMLSPNRDDWDNGKID